MNETKRRRAPTPQFMREAADFTLSNAKTYLGRLADKAARGEVVYILRGRQRFQLQHIPEIEPIPLRPPGYFAHDQTAEDLELDRALGRASVVRAPRDLE
jgi:hypothetical protein